MVLVVVSLPRRMSTAGDDLSELRQAFLRGDLTADELREQVADLGPGADREQLWLRWADQGLFEEPVTQEGFTSLAGNRRRHVDVDGERSG